MVRVILDYFKPLLFSSAPSEHVMDSVAECVDPKVSSRMNSDLDAPFTSAEIRKAVFQMAPSKALGKDEMSARFYQVYWEIVGEGVTAACLNFLNAEGSITAANATLIALIPKINSSQRIADYRPISFCNVLYKIISKVLVNRFYIMLYEIISKAQSAFIPVCLIIDNAILGFKCLHALRRRKKGVEGYMALKLDMSKTYNCVEWCFVEKMIRTLGFSVTSLILNN
ncbi:hypothetical protein ACOSQ3_017643 [Xanthoceras sorbifolium]